MNPTPGYDTVLPAGIRARMVDNHNGLSMHLLEAGFERPGGACVLLLHGFPELAYSWRKVMPVLAAAGYYVVAPDQRGYGRTTGWDSDYDGDLGSFRPLNLLRDTLGLLHALGRRDVAAVIGHDFGASVAAWCALMRPDVFRSLVLMSAPFAGPPSLPFDTANGAPVPAAGDDIHAALAALHRPRKHYQWYYSTREANADMQHCPQGVHTFLRAYFHHKSADWTQNRPHELRGWSASELARMPTYYIMDLNQNMAQTVAAHTPTDEAAGACQWLSDDELIVYSLEYSHHGFQGALQWYRCRTSAAFDTELEVFTGRTIDVPSCFIAGASDWGVYQNPGALQAMQEQVCTQFEGCHLLPGAGHWVQQEQSAAVNDVLRDFLAATAHR
jgi:pimeloyl-ACP methyl ester carboxylesterase